MQTARVLIIEDDRDIREMMGYAVKAKGCDVLEVDSRDTALIAIKRFGMPDMILMDYTMPGMTGEEFLAQLLNIQTRPPRIILVTAADEADSRARSLGIPEVIRKPFSNPLELFAEIDPSAA